jgi:3-mercaptopyruvate sulfurtransferase SseA
MSNNALLVAILVVASVAAIAIGVLQLAPAAVGPTTNGSRQAAPGSTPSVADVRRISVSDLHANLQGPNPPLLWDLRSAESYAQQHIPGARLVQISEIPMLAQGMDRKQAIVTLCA